MKNYCSVPVTMGIRYGREFILDYEILVVCSVWLLYNCGGRNVLGSTSPRVLTFLIHMPKCRIYVFCAVVPSSSLG